MYGFIILLDESASESHTQNSTRTAPMVPMVPVSGSGSVPEPPSRSATISDPPSQQALVRGSLDCFRNARLFIILFVRNVWRVCSQFWLSVRKRNPNPNFLVRIFSSGGRGLPRERVGAKKFDTSLETREIKLFGRDIPGFRRDIPGAPEKFEKKWFGFNFWPLILAECSQFCLRPF